MEEFPQCPCMGYRECPMCHDVRPCGHFGKSRWCPPCQRLRKQGMRPRPSRRGVMPAGRICAGEGCQTRLSVYNAGDLCSVCANNIRLPAVVPERAPGYGATDPTDEVTRLSDRRREDHAP